MDIKPLRNIIYLEFPEAKAGALDTSSRQSAVEYATVIAIGEDVTTVSCGDKVFVKSWAVDTINYEDKTYRFCNIETGGLLAVVK